MDLDSTIIRISNALKGRYEQDIFHSFVNGSDHDGINLFHINLSSSKCIETQIMCALLEAAIHDNNVEFEKRLIRFCGKMQLLSAIIHRNIYGANIYKFFTSVLTVDGVRNSEKESAVFVTMVKFNFCMKSMYTIIHGSCVLLNNYIDIFLNRSDIFELFQLMDIKNIKYSKFDFMHRAIVQKNLPVQNYLLDTDWYQDISYDVIASHNCIDIIDMMHRQGIDIDYDQLFEFCVLANNVIIIEYLMQFRKHFNLEEIFRHLSCYFTSMDIISVFLKNGIPNIILEEYAAEMIRNYNFYDVLELLKHFKNNIDHIPTDVINAVVDTNNTTCYEYLDSLNLLDVDPYDPYDSCDEMDVPEIDKLSVTIHRFNINRGSKLSFDHI